MALIKKPVNGMKDILPREMQIREYMMRIIKDTYQSFGYTLVETPCVEHIENLSSKQGGENEKLIFKILKRGEKLKLEEATQESEVIDLGLRYDLTLPLARYYSNHAANLPNPFKALQIGSVWRAERPQKGRFRQFTQCDIDILGEDSILAEIELILATTQALAMICPQKRFAVRINHRQLLKAMAIYVGFPEEKMNMVFISLDKMDKIGLEGVKKELLDMSFSMESIEKYLGLFHQTSNSNPIEVLQTLKEILKSDILEQDIKLMIENVITDLIYMINAVNIAKTTEFNLIFDPTLVRGMGYYTGTIFEISMEGFSSSVAGGGRYDKMIGRFTGKDISACGFSIGFERIITILLEQNFVPMDIEKKKVFLFEKGIAMEKLMELLEKAKQERKEGNIVLVTKMNKNKKFQKEQLRKEGYQEFIEFYKENFKK